MARTVCSLVLCVIGPLANYLQAKYNSFPDLRMLPCWLAVLGQIHVQAEAVWLASLSRSDSSLTLLAISSPLRFCWLACYHSPTAMPQWNLNNSQWPPSPTVSFSKPWTVRTSPVSKCSLTVRWSTWVVATDQHWICRSRLRPWQFCHRGQSNQPWPSPNPLRYLQNEKANHLAKSPLNFYYKFSQHRWKKHADCIS